jgi:hypothetical protein
LFEIPEGITRFARDPQREGPTSILMSQPSLLSFFLASAKKMRALQAGNHQSCEPKGTGSNPDFG